MSDQIIIRLFTESDIPGIVDSFYKANWTKPISLFETYLQESQWEERVVWVALLDNSYVGYVTLKWKSSYAPFANLNIPEIMDLNILPPFRTKGRGSSLLTIAEKEASKKSDVVGLGVGLYGGDDSGYGPAQRLYVTKGYVPDGNGVTYNYRKAN